MPPNPLAFTCFSNLPQELRLDIWEISAEEPRVVELRIVTEGGRNVIRSTPHGLLHANSESRAVLLKKCPNRLAAWEDNDAQHCVRFNPRADTIVLGDSMLQAMAAIFKDALWYQNMYPALNVSQAFNEFEILSGVQCLRLTTNSIELLGLYLAAKFFTHLAFFHHSILEIQIFDHKFPHRGTHNEIVEFLGEAQRRIWYKNFQQIGRPHPHPTRTRTMADWRQEFFFENLKFRSLIGSSENSLPSLRFFGATYGNVAPRQLLDVITDHQYSVNIPGTLLVEVEEYRDRWCSKCQIQRLAAKRGFSKVISVIRRIKAAIYKTRTL